NAEAIDVRDRKSHDGRVFLHAFVRLRKTDAASPEATAFAHQIDLLADSAGTFEQLVALSRRVRAVEEQTTEKRARIDRLDAETRRQIDALRQEIWSPRTPLERVYRRLGKYWRTRAAREK